MCNENDIEVYFDEENYCDFCGQLEPFDVMIEETELDHSYCLEHYEENVRKISLTLKKYIRKTELESKIEYYETKVADIIEDYEKLIKVIENELKNEK